MLENIRLSFQGIWGHKLRSLLTMLGVIIGIASIIAIVSTIKGTNEQIKENLIGSGTNAVEITLCQDGYTMEMEYYEIPTGVPVLSEPMRKSLLSIDGVESVTFYTQRTYVSNVFAGNNSFTGTVTGVDQSYFSTYGYQVYLGRDFSQADFDDYKQVILLDQKAAKTLFLGENPLGKTVEINQLAYTVIGLVEKSSSSSPVINSISDYYTYADTSSGTVFLPYTCWPASYQYDEPQNVAVRCANTDDMTTVGQTAEDILNANLSVGDDSSVSYKSQDLLEQAKSLQDLSSSTNVQLMWVAGISLLVGGIGVMNIMLVTVTERTKEIGLKKAIGAKKHRILWQFLTEAAVLTGMGGILGVVAGIVVAKVISNASATPTAISVPAIVIAVAFSVLIGVVFGLIPAVKAANLNPIEALRRE